jgi:hypothetical protein
VAGRWGNRVTTPTDWVLGFPESFDGNGFPQFSGTERRLVHSDPMAPSGRGEISDATRDGDGWHGLARTRNGKDVLCQKASSGACVVVWSVGGGGGAGRAWQISWGVGIGGQPATEREKMEM